MYQLQNVTDKKKNYGKIGTKGAMTGIISISTMAKEI